MRAHYAKLAKKLNSLLPLSSNIFTESERKEVEYLRDQKEYGLALQTHPGILIGGKRMSTDMLSVVESLAAMMGVTEALDLDFLRHCIE